MNLAILTTNIFFGDTLKRLLVNYNFKNGRSLILKDVTSENIDELDVVVSDYELDKLKDFLLKTEIATNKLKQIEKILITEKGFELLPNNNIYLKRPFKFVELVEVLQSMFERLKNKREDKKILGHISFIISDRKLIYRDKKSVELTDKESDIIISLLNSGDRGITKEEVMSQIWMLNINVETHTFETHLYRVRKKIKDNLFLKNFIINKSGRYYLNHEFIGQKN